MQITSNHKKPKVLNQSDSLIENALTPAWVLLQTVLSQLLDMQSTQQNLYTFSRSPSKTTFNHRWFKHVKDCTGSLVATTTKRSLVYLKHTLHMQLCACLC